MVVLDVDLAIDFSDCCCFMYFSQVGVAAFENVSLTPCFECHGLIYTSKKHDSETMDVYILPNNIFHRPWIYIYTSFDPGSDTMHVYVRPHQSYFRLTQSFASVYCGR